MDRCHRYVVVGFDVPAGVLPVDPAQGEGDPGKSGMPGPDDPGKPGLPGGEGPFNNGTIIVKGGFTLDHMGAIEFASLAAAQGWLGSPAGKLFQDRFKDVSIIATFGCHPPS